MNLNTQRDAAARHFISSLEGCPTGLINTSGLFNTSDKRLLAGANRYTLDAPSAVRRLNVTRCAAPKRPRGLQDCINLAVAGTGSTFLMEMLRVHSKHSHHNHFLRADSSRHTLLREARTTAPPCFFMTVRDPVARLESWIRFRVPRAGSWPFMSPEQLVLERFPLQPSALGSLDSLLVPQGDFLRGIDCDRHELHFLCTDTLEEDFVTLAAQFNQTASDAMLRTASANAAQLRYRGSTAGKTGQKPVRAEGSPLRDLSKLIRGCLYPSDAELYRLACARDVSDRR